MQTQDNRQMIPLAIVVAGALIAGAIYFGGSGGGSVAKAGNQANPLAAEAGEVAKVTAKDHIIGSPDAKVIIVEYSDIECPFCKVFHNTMHQVMTEYEGQSVAWVYRHFPIAQLHKKAVKEAEATECATEQGGNAAFWAYIDRLFQKTNSNDSLDLAELPKIAGEIGLDVAAFTACLDSGKYTETIQKAVADAAKAGARGTPYSVAVSGNKKVVISGAQSAATVKATIDSLLK